MPLLELLLLATCLLAFALVCSATDSGKVTMSKVADGVYLFTTSRYGDVGFGGNSVVILTSEGVVMFDTSGTPASGQAILSEVRKLTGKPVLYVVNSHWHWDHWGGNRVFNAAYPDVQFLSHAKTREELAAAEAKHAPEADLARQRELLAADEDFLQQKRSLTDTFPT